MVGMDAVEHSELDEVVIARIRADVATDRRRGRRAWWWGGLAGFVTVLVWQLSTQLVDLENVGQVASALAWSVLLACLLAPVAGIPYALLVRALGAPLDRWEDRRRHAH
ncbi:hypothetical protein JN535_04000 [Cellulosimicrobium cellulans]|uniref:hypothetical protein n=1 Tax=Cellulosimicrobium cellulans TaxID=1710 RepID=UPI001963E310|nr:hypothetical protein [Cellulosimicrobium cellulans]MBN0039336.1 hypothetical protein [Cellulosimicrobium cellulans]